MNRKQSWASRGAGVFVIAVLFGVACAGTAKEGSESHFIACHVDADCTTALPYCTAGHCQTTPSFDAGTDSAPASDAAAPLSPDAGFFDVAKCQRDAGNFISTLKSYCAAVAGDPDLGCPANRAAMLATVPGTCGPRGRYPSFERSCGVDAVSVNVNGKVAGEFFFDAASGALVGAQMILSAASGGPCGAGTYQAGIQRSLFCNSNSTCDLCVQTPELCPADIVAEIGGTPCGGFPDAGTCQCPTPFPELGSPCSTVNPDCAVCSSGTCQTACRCMRDGQYRYRTQCTE